MNTHEPAIASKSPVNGWWYSLRRSLRDKSLCIAIAAILLICAVPKVAGKENVVREPSPSIAEGSFVSALKDVFVRDFSIHVKCGANLPDNTQLIFASNGLITPKSSVNLRLRSDDHSAERIVVSSRRLINFGFGQGFTKDYSTGELYFERWRPPSVNEINGNGWFLPDGQRFFKFHHLRDCYPCSLGLFRQFELILCNCDLSPKRNQLTNSCPAIYRSYYDEKPVNYQPSQRIVYLGFGFIVWAVIFGFLVVPIGSLGRQNIVLGFLTYLTAVLLMCIGIVLICGLERNGEKQYRDVKKHQPIRSITSSNDQT
jgi:hypothetical protein